MKMLKVKLGTLIFAVLVIGVVSCNEDDDDNNDNNNNNNRDNKRNEAILGQIAQSNKAEIDLGNMASGKGADSSVILFGEMMADGHGNAQDEIDSLAEHRKINLPDSVNEQQSDLVMRLSALTGYQFDTAYMNSQVWMHTNTKDFFETVKDTTKDQSLKRYIDKFLPKVEMHLDLADSILNYVLLPDTTDNDTTNTSMRLRR